MRLKILCSLYLGFLVIIASGQHDSDSVQTPFSKGKSIVALGGSVSSSTNDRLGAVSDSKQFSNRYLFNIRLAKAVVDNITLGLSCSIEREQSNEVISSEKEILTIGPYSSFYLQEHNNGGFFLSAGVFYANYFEQNILIAPFASVDEAITGDGVAGVAGLGYTYVMKRKVGFEVGFNYRYSILDAKINNSIDKTVDWKRFQRSEIIFRFGFVVIFDPLN